MVYICAQWYLTATPWTVAHQASLSMGFSSQEYWSELPFPSPGDFPNPGIKPESLSLQVDSLLLSHLGCPSGPQFEGNCDCSSWVNFKPDLPHVPPLHLCDITWEIAAPAPAG